MGIKEIKGRSLPGRSEEPSPDRPTTTISEAEGKRAATEHQRERSEFEQRKGSKAPRPAAKKGPQLETSAFERGGRAIPRLNDPADDLERYPYPGQAGRHPAQDWNEQPAAAEKEPEPDRLLWGDEYEGEGEDPAAAQDGEEQDSEEEIAQGTKPVVEDLWIASGAAASRLPAIEPGTRERNDPRGDGAAPVKPVPTTQQASGGPVAGTPDLWEAPARHDEAHPALASPQPPRSPPQAAKQTSVIPTTTLEIPAVGAASPVPPPPMHAPVLPTFQTERSAGAASLPPTQASVIATTTLEMPVVELPPVPPSPQSAPRVLAPIPRGAQEHPPSDLPTQEVTAINAPAVEEAPHLLGEDVPTPTEVQDSPDPRSSR